MPDLGTDQEIREIKREIIESRGLIIKTNNLTNTLGSDIKSIAKRQAAYERKLTLNSAVAYVLTVGVIFVGAYLATDERARRFETERRAVEQENVRLREELERVQGLYAARQKVTGRATDLGKAVDRGDPEAALGEIAKTDLSQFSDIERRFFDQTAEKLRAELSTAAFQQGLEHAHGKRYGDAVLSFDRALQLGKTSPQASRVRLQLADALRLQGKQPQAIEVLTELLEAETSDRELMAEARWNLAVCYVEAHRRDEARRELIHIMREFPRSQWARPARDKLLEVQGMR